MRVFRRVKSVRGLQCLGLLGMLACSAQPSQSVPEVPSTAFTEHRMTRASEAHKQLGEDCTAHGASECLSGLCLRTQAEFGEAYSCSKTCKALGECPSGWKCAQVHSGASPRVCVPPVDWKAAVARPRGN